jgi:hypothetical protein
VAWSDAAQADLINFNFIRAGGVTTRRMEAAMSFGLDISASGLEAAQTLIAVAAQDQANLYTPGYQPQEPDLVDVPGSGGSGGDGVEIVDSTELSSDYSQTSPASNAVELAEDLRKAQVLYAANAAAINIQNQTFGNMINMLDTEQTQAPDEDGDSVL